MAPLLVLPNSTSTSSPLGHFLPLVLVICQNCTTNGRLNSNNHHQSEDFKNASQIVEDLENAEIALNWPEESLPDSTNDTSGFSSGISGLPEFPEVNLTGSEAANWTNGSREADEAESERLWTLYMQRIHKFHMIKAIVLVSVVVLILLSTCKMVFKLFVQFSDKQDKL